MKPDSIDEKILDLLQDDGRMTNAALAKAAGISAPAMLERIRRLEKEGIILRYAALVDPAKLNCGTFALVTVSLSMHRLKQLDRFTSRIQALEEVLECHLISGQGDFLLKVAVRDMKAYERFVFRTIKQKTRIPYHGEEK
jgi:Lrp/AsnC family leucine-responsive transcriptional regulator